MCLKRQGDLGQNVFGILLGTAETITVVGGVFFG